MTTMNRECIKLLKDNVYTEEYMMAINRILKKHIQDKVVIDLNCGAGYISILCALAGAKRVYAVEATAMATEARKVVEDNGLSDTIIVISRLEDIDIEAKADVLVSAWTDHYIIYKSTLESFFKVRDNLLKRDGLIFPSAAKLYMAPVTATVKYKKQQKFWKSVCGINMSSIFHLKRRLQWGKALVEEISKENILASPQVIMQVDCYRAQFSELKSFKSAFCFDSLTPATEEDVGHIDLNRPPQTTLHGFAFWFDTSFSCPLTVTEDSTTRVQHDSSAEVCVLSTAPNKPCTHWKQTVIYMNEPTQRFGRN